MFLYTLVLRISFWLTASVSLVRGLSTLFIYFLFLFFYFFLCCFRFCLGGYPSLDFSIIILFIFIFLSMLFILCHACMVSVGVVHTPLLMALVTELAISCGIDEPEELLVVLLMSSWKSMSGTGSSLVTIACSFWQLLSGLVFSTNQSSGLVHINPNQFFSTIYFR